MAASASHCSDLSPKVLLRRKHLHDWQGQGLCGFEVHSPDVAPAPRDERCRSLQRGLSILQALRLAQAAVGKPAQPPALRTLGGHGATSSICQWVGNSSAFSKHSAWLRPLWANLHSHQRMSFSSEPDPCMGAVVSAFCWPRQPKIFRHQPLPLFQSCRPSSSCSPACSRKSQVRFSGTPDGVACSLLKPLVGARVLK